MVSKTLRGVQLCDDRSGGNPPKASRRLLLVGMLYIMCAMLGVGIAANAWVLAAIVPELVGGGTSAVEQRYMFISILNIACDAVSLSVFLSFVLAVGRRAEFFSVPQTTRLVALGALNAAGTLFGLLMPTFSPPAIPGAAMMATAVMPELDLASLMLSVTFFALAGAFEYGRILQEDSNGIL